MRCMMLIHSLCCIYLVTCISALSGLEKLPDEYYLKPYCSVPSLCEQKSGYSYININESIVAIHTDHYIDQLACISISQLHSPVLNSEVGYHCFDLVGEQLASANGNIVINLPEAHAGLRRVTSVLASADGSIYRTTEVLTFFFIIDKSFNIPTRIEIISPLYGTISSRSLELQVKSASALYDYMEMDMHDQQVFQVSNTAEQIFTSDGSEIEAGSWFYTFIPRKHDGSGAGLPEFAYIESVLSPEDLREQRHFVLRGLIDTIRIEGNVMKRSWQQQLVPYFQTKYGLPKVSNKPASTAKQQQRSIHICIWSGTIMDGQKMIWLQQVQQMDATRFSFTFIITRAGEEDAVKKTSRTLDSYLTPQANLRVINSTLDSRSISTDELLSIPNDNSNDVSCAEYWQQNYTRLLEYMHRRFQYAKSIDQIQPLWVRDVYQRTRDSLLAEKCDILVYGNARGYSPDIMFTDVGTQMKIPMITELLNLHLSPDILPDVIVAPSESSLQHKTIQSPIQIAYDRSVISNKHTAVKPIGVVIQPSVDFNHFNRRRFDANMIQTTRAMQCGVSNVEVLPTGESGYWTSKHRPCILIGIVCRLAAGKNIGLVLQAAYHLYRKFSAVRFRIIGDGKVRRNLEMLANRLQIDHIVEFIGWVSTADLPQHLVDLDIVINPSLRGWSETFCISNIEVLAMEIPLVTFAVGGIGEYVANPNIKSGADNTEVQQQEEGWTVVSNAMILHKADPLVISDALFHLIQNPALASRMAINGRQSIISYFTMERQMKQYADLYESIYTAAQRS